MVETILLTFIYIISVIITPTKTLTELDYWYIANAIEGECGTKIDLTCYIPLGWTILNRYNNGQGSIKQIVTKYYYGFKSSRKISERAMEVAKSLQYVSDPTNGCIYAFSNSDVHNLGIKIKPDFRTKGTQFWRTWPVGKKFIRKSWTDYKAERMELMFK